MPFEVVFTDEFEGWWSTLGEQEQDSIARSVIRLQDQGPALARPYADTLHGSTYTNLRELRVQHRGRPYRVIYIFDPLRNAVLLIGGDKTGDNRWYIKMIPLAENIYSEYLRELLDARKARD